MSPIKLNCIEESLKELKIQLTSLDLENGKVCQKRNHDIKKSNKFLLHSQR